MNLTQDTQLGIYNAENYKHAEDAKQSGAIYETPSKITPYGDTWVYDILETVSAASQCVGSKLVLCAYVEGVWREIKSPESEP